jgi:translation elongation factor EF-G
VKDFREEGDRYQVQELEGGVFVVRHFPDPFTRRACCTVRVTMTDADRAKAIPDADPHGKAACLARATKLVEDRHARRRRTS